MKPHVHAFEINTIDEGWHIEQIEIQRRRVDISQKMRDVLVD